MQDHPYKGKTAYLATKHQKAVLIREDFRRLLSLEIEELVFDTDQLGTFSGEIERMGTAKETVLKKARLGIEISGCIYGLASEGSIGPDPIIPFINSDIEVMAFIDSQLGIEIVESFRSTEIIAFTKKIKQGDEIENFLTKCDFPNHKLIVRPSDLPTTFSIKGIEDLDSLIQGIKKCSEISQDGQVVIESDLRAHCSPSRQKVITQVGQRLANRISQLCPSCTTPGFGITSYLKGVSCQMCGQVSPNAIHTELLGCVKCSYSVEGQVINVMLDPAKCDWCNP